MRDHGETSQEERRRRRLNACIACRDRKVRCSGTQPCATCVRRSTTCTFGPDDRKVTVSERFLNNLKRKASQNELGERATNRRRRQISPKQSSGELETSTSSVPPSMQCATSLERPGISGSNLTQGPLATSDAETHISNPLDSGKSRFFVDETGRRRFLGPSSTWAYTRQVIADIKKYLNQPDSPDIPIHTDGHAYEFDWSLAEDKPFSKRELPSWDYALYLMNTVKFHIGQLYHLFDEATFTEGLHAFYHGRASEIPHFNLWYIQYLLVITFGKLFLVQRAPEDPPPGAIFFGRAMRILPDIKELYQDILLSLEILCGIALYLQCIDHRNTAYVYLGIALRIALTQGLHRDVDVESSSEHLSSRYRSIWWTLYILDRRFSSLMGAPISIQDSDVTMRLVNSGMADHRSEALVMNVKLSRIITSVLHSVYGLDGRLNRSFIGSVQRVLISLAELAPELQSRFGLSGSSDESISRVAGTLNLCYHQSVVLATRPVLVYILFEKLSVPSAGRAITEPIKALIKACFESAEKSLRILTALRSQDLLEAFLPFDIDCTHSSAFVILLIKAICLVPDISDCQTSYVDLATRILNTMIQKGSVTAQHRLSELQVLQDLLILLSERSTVLGEPDSTDMVSRSGPMLGGARTDVDVDQSGIEGVSAFPYYVDAIGDTGLSSAEMLEVARLLEWGDVLAEMPSEETQQRQDIACDQGNSSM